MIRDLLDEIREDLVADTDLSPTREIVYTRKSDSFPTTLNSYVNAGQYNKTEKENIANMNSFGGLKLNEVPKVGDTVQYDSKAWKVMRYQKLGTLYTVYCEITQHNARPSKRPSRG